MPFGSVSSLLRAFAGWIFSLGLFLRSIGRSPTQLSRLAFVFVALICAMRGQAQTLSSVSVTPTSVTGGKSSTGKVTLSAVAPAGGKVVTLSSSNIAATVPSSVTVAAGSSTQTFTVTTTTVASSTSATLSAVFSGVTKTAALAINAPVPSSVAVSPSSVRGGIASTGTVTLNGNAPTGGAVVTLSSNNAVATVPASVPVAAGASTATFNITTVPVASSTAITISAAKGGTTKTTTLTVTPPVPISLSLSPTSVISGASSTGTVTLTSNAPTGGLAVALTSSNACATVNATVTVAAGASSATFPISATSVSATTTSTISAAYGGTTKTATLTVKPAIPGAPTGLMATPGNGYVVLNWTAGSGTATTYKIFRRTSGSYPATPIATVSAPTTTYTNSGLTNGSTYYYVVKASNVSGDSATSNEAASTPMIVPSGGFETPVINNYQYNPAGSPWNFASQSGMVVNGSYFGNSTAPEGNQAAFLQGYGVANGIISQMVTLKPGNYRITFQVAQRTSTLEDFQLSLGGVILGTFQPTSTSYAAVQSVNFSISKTELYNLQFQSLNTGGGDRTVFLDNVQIVAGTTSPTPIVIPAPPIPPAPISLSAVSGSTQASLVWTASNGVVDYYNIKRSLTHGGPYITLGTTTSTNYLDTGLSNGTTYYYVISAVNNTGESNNSNEASATPNVVRNGGFETPVVATYQYNPTGSSWTFTGYAGIVANGGLAGIPPAPEGVQVAFLQGADGTNGNISQVITLTPGNYRISFQAAQQTSNLEDFRIVLGGVVLGTFQPTSTSYAGFQTVNFSIGTTGTYNLQFQSLNTGGGNRILYMDNVQVVAGSANPTPVVIPATPPAPSAPISLIATAGDGQVALTWTAATGALDNYKVKRALSTGGPYVTAGTGVATNYTDTGLINGTTYYYVVSAVNDGSEGANSNEASATPKAARNASFVSQNVPSAMAAGGTYAVDVTMLNTGGNTWTATTASAIYGYKLGSNNPTDNTTWGFNRVAKSIDVPSGSQANYNFNVIAPTIYGTYNFQWRMVQDNVAWFGDLTPNLSIKVGPTAPTNLTAVQGNQSVQLRWTAAGGINTYDVWRSTTSGSGYALIAPSATGTSYLDTGLTNGTTYYYVVTSLSGGFDGPNSNEAAATPQVPALIQFVISPTIVDGGDPSTGTVALGSFAPPGGLTINLTSSSPAANVPATVFIPAGQNSVSFPIPTTLVATPTTATITATFNGVSLSQNLTINTSCLTF